MFSGDRSCQGDPREPKGERHTASVYRPVLWRDSPPRVNVTCLGSHLRSGGADRRTFHFLISRNLKVAFSFLKANLTATTSPNPLTLETFSE